MWPLTLREAISKISPVNVSVDWISRIEGSDKSELLDQEFMIIHPKEFLRMKDRIPGIGVGLVDRLLKLRWADSAAPLSDAESNKEEVNTPNPERVFAEES